MTSETVVGCLLAAIGALVLYICRGIQLRLEKIEDIHRAAGERIAKMENEIQVLQMKAIGRREEILHEQAAGRGA
jgi:hypothetical protein